jgi:hypothetical protein
MDVHVIPVSGWPLYRPDPRFTLGWTELRTHPLRPDMGAAVVRVQLIEVAVGERGRGLGRSVVQRLAARHAGARLAAVSVPESAGFWAGLGWRRFEHGRDGGRLPLYVAPALR